MKDIDEAIQHCEDVAQQQDMLKGRYDDASGYTRSGNEAIRTSGAKKCEKCATDHRHLAEWLKELKQLREQTAWIPVSERLPEEDTNVLCWYEYFRYGNYNKMYQTYGVGTYFGRFGWAGDITGEKARVIAWMPLPEPYEPQESEVEE